MELPLDESSVDAPSSLKANQSKLIEANRLDLINRETPNAKDNSFGSTNANAGTKSPDFQEKFAMFQSDLPDISPAKSDVTSVYGGASVASTVVTEKTSTITGSYLVSPKLHKNAIKNDDEAYANIALSPNLLDKAVDTFVCDSNSSNATCTENEGTFSNEEEVAFKASENKSVLSPNLLDKASGIKSKLGTSNVKTSDKLKKGASLNLLDDAGKEKIYHNLQSTPTQSTTQQRKCVHHSMHKGAATTSYLPYKFETKRKPPAVTGNLNRSPTQENQNLSAIGSDSKILNDVIKLNLGPALTNEIMQSLVSGPNIENGGANIGINQINIDVDHDNHSEVSSLGTSASILSNAALSSLSALARSNPNESIENIIRGFNRLQRLQSPKNFNEVQNTSPLLFPSSQENTSIPTPNRVTFGRSPFHQTGGQNQKIKLQPSKVDIRRDRRQPDVQRASIKKEVPAVALDVFNDFERLQQQIEKAGRQTRVMDIANEKAERIRDEQKHETLMNQFEHIEKLENKRNWDAVTTIESLDCHRGPVIVPAATPLKSNLGTANDWFVKFDTTNVNGHNTDEPFSSLLRSDKTLLDESLIEEKKRFYAGSEEQVGILDDIGIDDGEEKEESRKKKKKKKVLKKMARMMGRMKKSKKDDEGSIGIASVTSLNNADDTVRKKHKFKFLSSLKRRKNKKTNNKVEQGNSSHFFEGENEQVSENNIIDAMDLMDSLDLDDLDESITTDDSDASSHVSKSSHAYATLS